MLKRRLCRKIRYVIHARRHLKQYLMNSLKYELIIDSIISPFTHTHEFITLILHRFYSRRIFFLFPNSRIHGCQVKGIFTSPGFRVDIRY